MGYQKVAEAKKCREKIYGIVYKYMEDKENIRPNSGQLKFLTGLMIREIAVSTSVKIQSPKRRIEDYLDHMILYDNDEVLSFFNPEKNLEAFLQSPYCDGFPYSGTYKPEYGTVPYLLLKKIQNTLEVSLKDYIRVKDPEVNVEKKEQAYLEFLFGIVIYEILLREYYMEIKDGMGKNPEELKAIQESMNLDQVWEEIISDKSGENQEKLEKLVEHTQQYYDKLCQYSFSVFYISYFVSQLTNLYALLRIIYLIEVVNVNGVLEPVKTKERRSAQEESKYWQRLVSKYFDEGTLFAPRQWRNKNLGILHNQLNEIYREKKIFPYVEETSKFTAFENENYSHFYEMKQYLELIIKHTAEERTTEEEKEMWTVQEKLSLPIWNAVEEITRLQDEVQRQKEEKKGDRGL